MDKLRDVYMNYKDLAHRCLIDIKQAEKGDNRVFYFKPDTFLLDDPEKQRLYREKLLKRITSVPSPEPITFMGDELHRQILETLQDQSQPTACKKLLADYYKRKQYTLQHKKYKVLNRWAHIALTSEYMERIGHEATFKYGKIEYDMENAMNRYERLQGEDDFDAAPTYSRPNTKAKEGGSLYVENTDLEPVSCIKQDDIDVYLRHSTYDQKINKTVNKFLARLKWLPLSKRFDIFQDAVEEYNKIKQDNLKKQEKFQTRIKLRGEEIYGNNNEEAMEELQMILEDSHFYKRKQIISSKADQIINSQKCDHEIAPLMIDNSIELKIFIVDKSLVYGIYGDIELDQGYSFAYQITIFFPTYFQKQIIKSQFSVYDAFAGEEVDQNVVQKRNLAQMTKIDTNIFRDISTTLNNIPTQESLNYDTGFADVKVMRLKAATWLDYVIVHPVVPVYIQQQAAYLNTNNPIDSLLKSALNFLDVNDLATVNRILEETARLHSQSQKQKYVSNKMKKKSKPKPDSNKDKKTNNNNSNNNSSMQNESKNIKDHFFSALRGEINEEQKDPNKDVPPVGPNSLRYLPQHLIHAYYILRHMKSRDFKTKILYCLNYFRSIQKRLMIDLREFGTRERVYGDQVQPIIPSEEADKVSQQNANANYYKKQTEVQPINQSEHAHTAPKATHTSASDIDKMSANHAYAEKELNKEGNYLVFEDGQLKLEQNLVDMKKFKMRGKFNNKIFSTCPILPRYHATFGEPVEFQPLNVEMERVGAFKHATDESIKLMGRIDHIEIIEKTKEVFVKDDFGVYVMYECAMQDMKDLEEEMIKIGSYYIGKHEFLINTENQKPYPLIDRLTLMEDLLDKEADFHFNKVILIQNYIECYEHISDPLEQQRLIQIITDIMASRPRLNLQSTYFIDSYNTESTYLMRHQELVRQLIYNQMKIEKEENKRLQAYIDLSYKIMNEQGKGKWTYADAEDFFNELKKRKAQNSQSPDDIIGEQQEKESKDDKKNKQQNEEQKDNDLSPTKRFLQKIQQRQYGSKYSQHMKLQVPQMQDEKEHEAETGFAAVLGLPPITVESLYAQYKEKDDVILEIMNEHANYVKVYEGYPDFMVDLQLNHTSRLGSYKVTLWSMPINILDFFESLNFINKLYATLKSAFTELVDVLKPHDNTLLTLIEVKILERAEIEFKKTQAFIEGHTHEYIGHEYLEDDTLLGNSDKIDFFTKDLLSHLQKTQKQNINPFLIGKLDIESINFFEFPNTPKDQHPFKRQRPLLSEDIDVNLKIVNANVKKTIQSYQKLQHPNMKEYMRKINLPSMLTLSCNSVELLRLRQELIYAMSESCLLQEVYEQQCKNVNRQNFKVLFNDSINFDNYLIDQSKVNFIDEGAANFFDLDLAINEFDPMLKSNLNFRNPDAIKMLLCSSGLEELRGVLHYQLMQKQLLIIGVRFNQLLIDTHLRALSELELVKKGYSLPNMVIKLQNILSKTGDGFNHEGYQRERQKFTTNMNTEAAQVFYAVTARKTKLRNTVSKKFSTYLTSVASTYTKVECSLRVLRAHKVKLLHSYCKEVLKEAYYDAIKIQAINTCQRIRIMSQLFNIDDNSSSSSDKNQIFKYETGEYFENFFSAYNPIYIKESQGGHGYQQKEILSPNSVINPDRMEILDYYYIPSTITLGKLDAISQEELNLLNQKHPIFDFIAKPEENDVESSIKSMLPHCTDIMAEYPKEDPDKDRVGLRVHDFQESYDYTTAGYTQVFTQYALMERIMTLEFFMSKLSSNLLDTLKLEHSVFNGLPFWNSDLSDELGVVEQQQQDQNGALAEKILNKIVAEKRAKVNLADDMMNMQQSIQNIIQKMQNPKQTTSVVTQIPRAKAIEYMITYHEFRFFYLIHVLEKLIDNYYHKGMAKEVKAISEIHQALTKREHVTTTYKHNAFHVNLASIKSDQFSFDPQNLSSFHYNSEERTDFENCIQPIVNEQAMNPPQITIFQGMFMNPRFKTTQYAGQIPHYPRKYAPLQVALMNLPEKERQYANSTAHSIKSFLKDYLEVVHRELIDSNDEGYQLDHLKKCKRFLSDLIQARQLKNALICWLANSTLPLDPEIYNQYLIQYKNEIFWKIMNQKDQLPSINTTIAAQDSIKIGSGLQSTKQNQNNDRDDNDMTQRNKEAEQSMILSMQLQSMQQQVMVDQVQTCKAEILVLSSEIERQIVKAAISAVDLEQAALANCFATSVKQIEMHVHPFQQFASTLYAGVDKNSHLDMVTKVSEVQKFITKLRNRGTEVETLTSGPGMVFTVKDFNECLQQLCRGLIKYSEAELRSRSEQMCKKESHYMQLIYYRDRRIDNLEERISNTRENLDKLINSKMYEKGNQLIYELDCVNRQLRLFKDNVFSMEKELRSQIRSEFADTLRKNFREIDTTKKKFQDFKTDVTTKVKADLALEQFKIEKALKKKAEEFKNLSKDPMPSLQHRGSLPSSPKKIPADSTQSQFNKNPDKFAFTGDLTELNDISEREARAELAQMWDIMRKLRLFWKTKEVLVCEKYEREIFTMKKQLTSNACLWEQLAEAEKREKVFKQELVFTQQSLAASEKVIEKLKDDLRKSESDRVRLNQYKTNKSQRLEELEGKVRKFEVLDNINLEKLIDTLGSKEKEILKLRDVERNFNQRLDAIETRKNMEIRDIKYVVNREQGLKKDVLERLESLRMELRMLEKNEGSMAEVWKSKCKELVEICNKLKAENDSLRDRISLIAQTISMQEQSQQDYNATQRQSSGGIQLPKLMSNQSHQKMTQNIQASKYGSAQHSRQSSVIKNDQSLERSYIGGGAGVNDLSTQIHTVSKGPSHQRGRSIHDGPFPNSKSKDSGLNQSQHNIQTQQKPINFAILGQTTTGGPVYRGFQSVRTSQVQEGKLQEEASSFLNSGGRQNFKQQEILSNTTAFTKGIKKSEDVKSPYDINSVRSGQKEVQNEEIKSQISQKEGIQNSQEQLSKQLSEGGTQSHDKIGENKQNVNPRESIGNISGFRGSNNASQFQ